MAVGATEMLDPVATPTPWLIDTEVAPVTCQPSTDDPPAAIVDGEAVNDSITATGADVTVTVTLALELPEAFVAVSV